MTTQEQKLFRDTMEKAAIEIEKLRVENARLKAENEQLRQERASLTGTHSPH